MDERGAIDGVFAVVTRIVVATANVHPALANERIKRGVHTQKLRGTMAWIFLRTVGHALNHLLGRLEGSSGHFGGRQMTRLVGEAGKGQGVGAAATLVIQT